MNVQEFKEGYGAVLKGFLETHDEQHLARAAELGRELADATTLIRQITSIHQEVTEHLVKSHRYGPASAVSQLAFKPLQQILSAYGDSVSSRLEETTAARKKAETANRARTRFLANIGQDIRTPINAIIGFTHLMQQSSPAQGQLERLNKIDVSASHLLSIIDDILDLTMIEAGEMSLEKTNFRLGTILNHIESLFKEQLEAKGLRFKMDLDESSDWFCGDPNRLRQILLNYVSNAIKFTTSGGVSVRGMKLEQKGNRTLVRFEVKDSGVGIEPDRLEALFKPFKASDNPFSRKSGGTGLSLAINRDLARLMGGDVGVESEPGKGSTFWFSAWLDGGKPGESSEVKSSARLGSDYSDSRILLVEDNAINREVAMALLKSAGLSADMAENGLMALPMIYDKDYDVVLMDLQMPEMDGLEATRIIRATPELIDLPILAMTANVFVQDRQACLAAGMNDFIAKPIDVNNLFTTLVKWLPGKEGTGDADKPLGKAPDSTTDTLPAVAQARGGGVRPAQDGVVFDPEALNAVLGEGEAKTRLLTRFVHETENLIGALEMACEQEDASQVAFHSHKLKSSARTVGANGVSDLCYDLEIAGREEAWTDIEQLTPQLRSKLAPVKEYLARQ